MSNRRQVWEDWMLLAVDIGNIAAIAQNEMNLTEEDWQEWLEQIDRFKTKFEFVKRSTMELKSK